MDDLDDLRLAEGIQVWGTKQETLEEQALKELDIFSEENKIHREKQHEDLEEGKLVDSTKYESSETKLPQPSLNLEAYLKTQEDLRKRQAFKKTLACTDASKEIANRISQKLNRSSKKRKAKTTSITTKKQKLPETLEVTDNDNVVTTSESDHLVDNSFENLDSGSEYIPSENEIGKLLKTNPVNLLCSFVTKY